MPTATGARFGDVQVASDDADENPFDFPVTGMGITNLVATFNTANDVAVSSNGLTATGNTVALSLGFAPSPGTCLTVVDIIGASGFISGTFTGLANGQEVTLSFGMTDYKFIAWYYGGADGRDLVLVWKDMFISAWGYNVNGALGNKTILNSVFPVRTEMGGVLKDKTVVSLAAGYAFSAAVTTEGLVYTWGQNANGQLGDGTNTGRTQPVQVDTGATSALNGKTVVAVACGSYFTLALTTEGRVYSWGENDYGQLGDGTNGAGTDKNLPVAVDVGAMSALNGKTVVAIAAGLDHALALTSEGQVVSWGRNDFRQLGDNTTTSRNRPVFVNTGVSSALNGRVVVQISAGYLHNLVLTSTGVIASWGSGGSGRLGDGTTNNGIIPITVNSAGSALLGKNIISVSAGGEHSMALSADGLAFSWGENSNGQLGDGGTTDRLLAVAVDVSGSSALMGKVVTAISASLYHTIAIDNAGLVYGWGRGQYGRIGDGTQTSRNSPVAADTTTASALTGVKAAKLIAAKSNSEHSLVLVGSPPAEIELHDGATTASPQLTDGQTAPVDYGNVVIGTNVTKTFTISSVGLGDLTSLNVTLSGPSASDYTVVQPTSELLLAGQTRTFTVRFAPISSGLGQRDAVMHLANNDEDESPFDVPLTGFAGAREISVFRGADDAGVEIIDGQAAPVRVAVTLPGVAKSRDITIKNTGNLDLTISSISVSGGNFSISNAPTAPLGTGGTATFTINFSAATAGTYSGTININNNDADEQPFNFPINGIVSLTPYLENRAFTALDGTGSAVPGQPAGTTYGQISFSPSYGGTAGLLRDSGGTVSNALFGGLNFGLVASTTTQVPSMPVGTTFLNFRECVANVRGRVAFLANIQGAGINRFNRLGVFTNAPDGVLKMLARVTTADLTGSTFSQLGPVSIAGDGVVFQAISAAGKTSVYAWNNTLGLTLLFSSGDVVNINGTNKTVSSFLLMATNGTTSGQGREHVLNLANEELYTFVALFTDNTQAIIKAKFNGATYTGFTASYAAPGQLVDFAAGASPAFPLAEFGNFFRFPAWDQNGEYYGFVSSLEVGSGDIPVSSFDDSAIFADLDPDQLVMQVRENQAAPGASGGVFHQFTELVMGAGNATSGEYEFAFLADLRGTGVNSTNDSGLWAKSNTSGLVLLAREGGTPPGVPSVAQYQTFTELALPSKGQPIFTATLRIGLGGVTSSNDTGLWMTRSDSVVALALREGAIINVGGANRTVSKIQALGKDNGTANPRGFDREGILIFWVEFLDGTGALIEAEAP